MFHVSQVKVTTAFPGAPPLPVAVIVEMTEGPNVGMQIHASYDPATDKVTVGPSLNPPPGSDGAIEFTGEEYRAEFKKVVRMAAISCFEVAKEKEPGKTTVFARPKAAAAEATVPIHLQPVGDAEASASEVPASVSSEEDLLGRIFTEHPGDGSGFTAQASVILASMPEDEKRILRFVKEGRSNAEIAQAMGKSEKAVANLRMRTLANLKAALDKVGTVHEVSASITSGVDLRVDATLDRLEDQIARLPRLARVAFAARCARRVEPLFKRYWPEAPDGDVRVLGQAIAVAERVSDGTYDDAHPYFIRDVASLAHSHTRGVGNATLVAKAAFRAVEAALKTENTKKSAAEAASASVGAGGDPNVESQIEGAMWRDLEYLLGVAALEGWTDRTPVPLSRLGSLWPAETPKWWPEGWPVDSSPEASETEPDPPTEGVENQGHVLSLYFLADEVSADDVAECIDLLSELYASMGGDELKIVGSQRFTLTAGVLV